MPLSPFPSNWFKTWFASSWILNIIINLKKNIEISFSLATVWRFWKRWGSPFSISLLYFLFTMTFYAQFWLWCRLLTLDRLQSLSKSKKTDPFNSVLHPQADAQLIYLQHTIINSLGFWNEDLPGYFKPLKRYNNTYEYAFVNWDLLRLTLAATNLQVDWRAEALVRTWCFWANLTFGPGKPSPRGPFSPWTPCGPWGPWFEWRRTNVI